MSDRIIVQQLHGHWTAWWEHEPQIAFGGVTPAEAVDRLVDLGRGPGKRTPKPQTVFGRGPLLRRWPSAIPDTQPQSTEGRDMTERLSTQSRFDQYSIVLRRAILSLVGVLLHSPLAANELWTKHVVHEGPPSLVAVAADVTGDGRPDVISNSAGKTRLFVAPDWRECVIDETEGHDFIHGETFDVDLDGDPDFIGARYAPGLIVWLECPDDPTAGSWATHLVDDQLNGIHGVLKGDVDGDRRPDLLANSAQPVGAFPNSAAWLKVPDRPRNAERWHRYIFAQNDAPGLSHYFGFGDINGDGRADIALAAKGGEQDPSGLGEWFAWWEAPKDPTQEFQKHVLPGRHPGATNIQPADINGDGRVDLLGSRGHGVGLFWFENPTWDIHDVNTELRSPHCLQVVDMDGDGDIDAATCAYESEVAAWFENDGRGNFTTHVVGRNQAAYDIRAVDLDVDGDLDLLIAGQNSKNVVWYEHPGAVRTTRGAK